MTEKKEGDRKEQGNSFFLLLGSWRALPSSSRPFPPLAFFLGPPVFYYCTFRIGWWGLIGIWTRLWVRWWTTAPSLFKTARGLTSEENAEERESQNASWFSESGVEGNRSIERGITTNHMLGPLTLLMVLVFFWGIAKVLARGAWKIQIDLEEP
jgi:hypothetical protein